MNILFLCSYIKCIVCIEGTDLTVIEEKDESETGLVISTDINCVSINEMECYNDWLPHCGAEALEEEEELWITYIESDQIKSILTRLKNPEKV